jgi:hypothetical protein
VIRDSILGDYSSSSCIQSLVYLHLQLDVRRQLTHAVWHQWSRWRCSWLTKFNWSARKVPVLNRAHNFWGACMSALAHGACLKSAWLVLKKTRFLCFSVVSCKRLWIQRHGWPCIKCYTPSALANGKQITRLSPNNWNWLPMWFFKCTRRLFKIIWSRKTRTISWNGYRLSDTADHELFHVTPLHACSSCSSSSIGRCTNDTAWTAWSKPFCRHPATCFFSFVALLYGHNFWDIEMKRN